MTDRRAETGDAASGGTVRTELVRVRTEDGVALDGARWTPEGARSRTGFVLCAGTGTEFCTGWLGWLGPHLAGLGYPTVALNRRDHGAAAGFFDLETASLDHGQAVDLVCAAGAERVVMAGHSYGTLTAPCYVVATGDARVAALVLYAPLGDLRQATVTICGGEQAYAAAVAAARRMVAAGHGADAFLTPPMIPGGLPLVHSYAAFLAKRGPDARTVGPDIVRQIRPRPILAIRDPHDPFPATHPPAQQRYEAIGPSVRYVLLEDRGPSPEAHGFGGREEEVLAITSGWLSEQGLAG